MKVFIVYCHPSHDSFTYNVKEHFIQGLLAAGHEYTISDLYAMNFQSDMTEKEYLRDSNYSVIPSLEKDVIAEQEKINTCDALVFIYPVFWTDVPSKLKGWFDRVWSYGFAYGNKTMKLLDKALILCTTGNSKEDLEHYNLLYSMKKIMLGDRLFKRVKETDFVVFDKMTKALSSRSENWDKNLELAFNKGKNLFAKKDEEFSLEDKYFVAIENSSTGEVSEKTIFKYHQKEHRIWAEYSGGDIIQGFLIGTIDDRKNLHFSYQHLNSKNEVKSGFCTSTPEILSNGKLLFHENWQWTSGEKGYSIIKEL